MYASFVRNANVRTAKTKNMQHIIPLDAILGEQVHMNIVSLEFARKGYHYTVFSFYLVNGAGEHEILLVIHRVLRQALQEVTQSALSALPCLDGRAQHHGGRGLPVRQLEGVDHHRQRRGFAGCVRSVTHHTWGAGARGQGGRGVLICCLP